MMEVIQTSITAPSVKISTSCCLKTSAVLCRVGSFLVGDDVSQACFCFNVVMHKLQLSFFVVRHGAHLAGEGFGGVIRDDPKFLRC